MKVVKEGSRSRFTENKTVLSQFTKNKDMMKITLHGELNIYFSFHRKQFWKITLHGYYGSHDSRGKIGHFTFNGKKKEPITSHENTLYHPRSCVMKRSGTSTLGKTRNASVSIDVVRPLKRPCETAENIL